MRDRVRVTDMKQKTRSVTILITVLSGVLTAASGIFANIASSQLQGLQLAWPVLCFLTLGGIGLSIWQSFHGEKSDASFALRERRNRRELLARVQIFWISGVLEHSLHGAVLVALGLHEQPDAVTN